MAKILQGPNGGWLGKLGQTVGYLWKGTFVDRVYNGSPNNPRTARQVEARRKFAVAGQMASALIDAIRMGFHKKANAVKSTQTGEFVKRALPNMTYNALTDSVSVAYEGIKVSDGTLTGVGFDEPDLDNPLTVKVGISEPHAAAPDAKLTDEVYVVLYNKGLKRGFLGHASRNDESVEVIVPGHWQGTQVEIWGFVKRAASDKDPFLCSETTYLGSGTIA